MCIYLTLIHPQFRQGWKQAAMLLFIEVSAYHNRLVENISENVAIL